MTGKKKENLYMLMALTGNVIFGFSFLFSKIALNVAKPPVLLAVRFSVAFLLMSVLVLFKVVPCDLKGKSLKPLITMGIMQPVCYFICESYGLSYASSSFAGIIIALVPIAGLMLAMLLLKEKPTLVQLIFSATSVLGVIILTTGDTNMDFELIGLLFLIGAVFAGSMFNILSKKIADQYTAFERTYVMFGVGMVFFVLMAIVQCGKDISLWTIPLTNSSFWLSILYLSCISSIGAFMLLNKSLDVLPATRTLVFANVTSIISVLAGVFFLHERIGIFQVIGIVIVLVSVYAVNKNSQ